MAASAPRLEANETRIVAGSTPKSAPATIVSTAPPGRELVASSRVDDEEHGDGQHGPRGVERLERLVSGLELAQLQQVEAPRGDEDGHRDQEYGQQGQARTGHAAVPQRPFPDAMIRVSPMNRPLAALPSVDRLLRQPEGQALIARHGRPAVTDGDPRRPCRLARRRHGRIG